MLSFVDATKRPLSIPPRFVPYMEKYKIHQLFQELASELIIKMPDDHIVFLKQCLPIAAKRLDLPRVVLIAPPTFDSVAFVEVIERETGIRPITLKYLRGVGTIADDECSCDESEHLAKNMRKLLKTGVFFETGWILVDVPRTKREARALQSIGIIPTHVLEVKSSITNYAETADTITTFHPPLYSWHEYSKSSEHRDYMKNLRGLREAYRNLLIEVECGIRSIEDFGKDCAKLIQTRKPCGAPSIFRIVLIGRRGSGCRSLAKHLSQKFDITHVDFDYILQQARLQETELGEMLRLFEHRWGQRPKPETRIQIVERYILKDECLRQGWVLTGYPISVEDFKLLDMVSTPPNRVLFVNVDESVCRERILDRRYNVITGSTHNLACEKCYEDDWELGIHPRDYKRALEQDIQEYEEHIEEIMEYAGETSVVIDGNCEERTVRERLETCLMHLPPSRKPRTVPSYPEIDPAAVEFDPSDEPDPRVFDELRSPESTYSFV